MNDNLPPGVTEDDVDRAAGVPRKLLWPAAYPTLDADEQSAWDEEVSEWSGDADDLRD